jgi:D-galactarolactone cycloisomerase
MTAAVVEAVAPWLVGEDPLRTDALWQMVYARLRDHGQKGVVIQGLSGIDIALWDVKGKHFGVPVHRLLGGPLRTKVRAYATGLYRRKSGDPLAYLAEEAAGYAREGFTAVKLKVGFGVAEDAAVTSAVREAIGAGVGLMVDANHAFDAVAAIRLGRMIEDCDIGWFEEPVPPEDLAGYRAVKAALSIPIAGGECEFTRYGFRELLVSRAVDIVQPDTCAAGGSPSARRSPTCRRRSASATIRTSGAPGLRSRPRCSSSPCCRRTRRHRSALSSRCSSSTAPSIRSARRSCKSRSNTSAA